MTSSKSGHRGSRPAVVYQDPIAINSLVFACGLPLRLDSYRGCSFQCSFCFARGRERVRDFGAIAGADPSTLERLFQRIDRGAKRSLVTQCLERRIPIHFGGMSDPFLPQERTLAISLSFLRSLRARQYPTVISTRGELIASAPYINELREMESLYVRISMSTTNDRVATAVESNQLRASRLLKTIEILRKSGISVGVRWQPYLPGLSEAPSLYLRRIAEAGAMSISFEHLKLPSERSRLLELAYARLANHDIYGYYREKKARLVGRDLLLPAKYRLHRVLRVRALARSNGLLFGCADNDLQHLSDAACCCSGVDKLGGAGFQNWYRFQTAFAVRESLPGGVISFAKIARQWHPAGSLNRYLHSKARILATTEELGSVENHLTRRWNGEGVEGSPSFYHGVEWRGEWDRNGRKLFRWSPDFLAEIACPTQGGAQDGS